MKTLSRRTTILSTGIAIVMLMLLGSKSFAQDMKKSFALKGCNELGGSISFQSISPVSNGNTGDAATAFSVAPYVGYFVSDGFEIGLNPFGIQSISYGGYSSTGIMIFLAPSYNFRTEGNAYPFIEGLVGYTSSSGGSSSLSGLSWGGRGGVKIAVTSQGLLVLGVQYLLINESPDGAVNRYGSNQLTVSGGFTIWM